MYDRFNRRYMETYIVLILWYLTIVPLSNADTTNKTSKELEISCVVSNVFDIVYFLNNVNMEWHFQRNQRTTVISRKLNFNITGTNKYDFRAKNCSGKQHCKQMGLDMDKGTIITLIIKNADECDHGLYSCLVMYNDTTDRNVAVFGNADTAEDLRGNILFTKKASAEEAYEKCQSYGYQMAVVSDDRKLNYDKKKIIKENETVWIGSNPWLYMSGCFNISVASVASNTLDIKDCRMIDFKKNLTGMSKVVAVGVRNGTCFIFERIPLDNRISEFHCQFKCSDIVEGNCGGTDALSLYKIVHVVSEETNTYEEECTALYRDTIESAVWRIPCADRCDQFCFNYTSKEYIPGSYASYTSWKNAVNNCFEKNGSLPGIRHTYTNSSFQCLGVFRNAFIMNATQITMAQKINGEFVLENVRESVKLPFMCRSDVADFRTMNQSFMDESPSVRRPAVCSEENVTLESTFRTSDSTSPSEQMDVTPKMNAESSGKITVIVITCSVVGLTALIAIIVCLRTRVFTKYGISQNTEEMNQISRKKENLYSDVGDDVTTDYSKVTKLVSSEIAGGNHNCYDYSDVEKIESEYAETEAGEYDLLQTKRKKKDCNDESMYDKTDNSLGGLYDVTNKQSNGNKHDVDNYYSSVIDQSKTIKPEQRVDNDNNDVDN